MNIGDTVWVYDSNTRPSLPYGSIEYRRALFCPFVIEGETRTSWIINHGQWRVGKKTLTLSGRNLSAGADRHVYTSAQEVEDAVWMQCHQHLIVDAVRRLGDCQVLREIAALIGYKG